ncbi:3-carboxy-cis,cis-muconate cycloisomerase [Rhizobiales bacterium GAS113]|nr:3-carboxy-cis,cis-muconate cycloisomerase [Rhizobiales bacterium GAS113]
MPSMIQARMASSAEMLAVFSDEALIAHALAFEAALAQAEAECGVIPQGAAEAIAEAVRTAAFDAAALAEAAARGGTLAIPLVKELGSQVAAIDRAAAGHVHFGGTSQDLADTALVLQLRVACALLRRDLRRLRQALARLTEAHRGTVMLARTLMQPALPTTFGLKAASWLTGIEDAAARLEREAAQALMLQFGGAAGTLSALADKGVAVALRLAALLGLPLPPMPWHTRRDGIAGLACAVGILTGALGKIARDLSLLSQAELGEAAEPSGPGRGGSSTLPHKRNPIAAMVALAAANRAPGLVATLLSAMPQELERALGGWQSEAPTLASLFELAHGALLAMVEAIEGLKVDPLAMRRNLDRLNGLVLAERLMLALAPLMGRNEAYHAVEELSRRAVAENRQLRDLALADARVTAHLAPDAIAHLFDPSTYLGAAQDFIDAALAAHRKAETNTRS